MGRLYATHHGWLPKCAGCHPFLFSLHFARLTAFFFFSRRGSRWLFLPGVARRFFLLFLPFCLRCLSQTMFATRAFKVLRQYPTPTTVFTMPILLPLEICFDGATHDLSVVVPFAEVQKKRVRVYRGVVRMCFTLCLLFSLCLSSLLCLLSPPPISTSSFSWFLCLSHLFHPTFANTTSEKGSGRLREYDFLCVQCFFFTTKVY